MLQVSLRLCHTQELDLKSAEQLAKFRQQCFEKLLDRQVMWGPYNSITYPPQKEPILIIKAPTLHQHYAQV